MATFRYVFATVSGPSLATGPSVVRARPGPGSVAKVTQGASWAVSRSAECAQARLGSVGGHAAGAVAGVVDDGRRPSPAARLANFAHANGRRPRAPEPVRDVRSSVAEPARRFASGSRASGRAGEPHCGPESRRRYVRLAQLVAERAALNLGRPGDVGRASLGNTVRPGDVAGWRPLAETFKDGAMHRERRRCAPCPNSRAIGFPSGFIR